MKPQIINIINFVRGVEPRNPDRDLVLPVRKQIEIMSCLHLTGTFLIQYDAMMKKEIVGLLKKTDFEIGIWLEIVEPLAEKAGVKWKGRPGFPWDWHVNAGFTIAYTPSERRKMIDVFMGDFKETFGFYPESAGCWLIDAETLGYMEKQYDIKAFCNCRDQWGTDGYTLWGGYYGQGYYPSRYNAFLPAQHTEKQIRIPVFRMLGSDPIYQYDAGLDENFNPCNWQDVKTLEPANEGSGASPEWVRWFFKENFSGICLSFGYAQTGQENSFGWEAMKDGIEDQFQLIADYSAAGMLQVMTLGDTGKWYREKYSVTPSSAVAALSDWSGADNRSVWYSSRYYRANIIWSEKGLYIRDIHLFHEKYAEPFLVSVCDKESCVYDSLPLIDGNRWSGNRVRAGIYPVQILSDGSLVPFSGSEVSVDVSGDEELAIIWHLCGGGSLKITCASKTLEAVLQNSPSDLRWALAFKAGIAAETPKISLIGNSVFFVHNGFRYCAIVKEGEALRQNGENFLSIMSINKKICICLEQEEKNNLNIEIE